MAVDRIWLPGDLVGRVSQTFLGGGGGNALGDGGIALDGAEFGFQIRRSIDAFARNPGVEEIGAPVDVDLDAGIKLRCGFESVFADVAPGSHDVGNDVGLHRNRSVRFNGHDRKPSWVLSYPSAWRRFRKVGSLQRARIVCLRS
jgi:hypothetical protein